MAKAVCSPVMLWSRSRIRQCFAAAVVISNIIVCLLTSPTTALPMKDAVGQAMKRAKRDGQQQQQQQQPQYHREKREVDCVHPSDMQLLYLFVLSNKGNSAFLDVMTKGNDTCSTSWGADLSPLADRCPCPHFFKTYQLPNGTFPTSLKGAHCMSQKCLKMNAYGCQTVWLTINILKASGCQNGTLTYDKIPYELSTDCVCVDGTTLTSTTTSAPGSTVEPWWVD